MLQTGSIAPDFKLPNEDGAETSLSELLRTGPIVLYFYPADFTPGCTREACDIRDMHAEIVAAGLRVVGISPQDNASHERFRDEYQLPYQLLSDPDKSVIRQYDVDGPFGVGVRRATYLISPEQRVQAAVQADFMIRRHKEFIRKAIALRG